jgi:hypothetical protein
VDANNSVKKTVDPRYRYTSLYLASSAPQSHSSPSSFECRFTDVSGKLDERIFSKNYSFLDEYRDNEIEVLSKTVKKMKNPAKKEEVKAELLKYVPSYFLFTASFCYTYVITEHVD